MAATTSLPANLEPKRFVKDTGGIVIPRGPSLKLLDASLSTLWTTFIGANEETKVTQVCDVLKGCDDWLRSTPKDGNRQTVKETIKSQFGGSDTKRRIAVQQVGEPALKLLYDVQPKFRARIQYEDRKFHTLLDPRSVKTKPMEKPYANERTIYTKDNKKIDPPAGSSVLAKHTTEQNRNKFVEKMAAVNPDVKIQPRNLSPLSSEDAKNFTTALGKKFNELTVEEFEAIGKYANRCTPQPVQKVGYLKREERLKHMVFCEQGRLKWYNPRSELIELFDTNQRERIVVFDRYNNIYSSPNEDFMPGDAILHHSSYVAGNEVAFAGKWIVSSGVLCLLTGESGHYKPGFDEVHAAIAFLYKAGISLQYTQLIIFYMNGQTSMRAYFGPPSPKFQSRSNAVNFATNCRAPYDPLTPKQLNFVLNRN